MALPSLVPSLVWAVLMSLLSVGSLPIPSKIIRLLRAFRILRWGQTWMHRNSNFMYEAKHLKFLHYSISWCTSFSTSFRNQAIVVCRLFGRIKSVRQIISALSKSILPVMNALLIMFAAVCVCENLHPMKLKLNLKPLSCQHDYSSLCTSVKCKMACEQ